MQAGTSSFGAAGAAALADTRDVGVRSLVDTSNWDREREESLEKMQRAAALIEVRHMRP